MPKIDIPKLRFSAWHKWVDRNSIKGVEQPGVYLLAISSVNLVEVSSDYKNVSYIGMTVSKNGLKGRWQQLDRSLRGLGGHSGANRIFASLGEVSGWGHKKLYVAAFPVPCNAAESMADNLRTKGKVCYLEYEAFARFFEHQHKKPYYNTR